MRVKDLIAKLQEFDQDKKVMVESVGSLLYVDRVKNGTFRRLLPAGDVEETPCVALTLYPYED